MKKPLPVRFDSVLHARVKEKASRYGLTVSDIVRWSVIQHLDEMDSGTLKLRTKKRKSA